VTCDQAKDIFYDQEPWNRTKAELASFIAHVKGCRGQCVEVRARLTAYIKARSPNFRNSESYKQGAEAYRELQSDPEAVEVMFPQPKGVE
jgi:hypothetical protein